LGAVVALVSPSASHRELATSGAVQDGAGDVAVGGERDDRCRDVAGLADAACRKRRRPEAEGLRSGLPAMCGRSTSGSTAMGSRWYRFPMEAVVDQAGRIVLPKFIRDALGLLPGTKVDISPYGAGVQVVPAGRTARLVEENGVLVSAGETPVDDDILFGLIDAGRR
jgi:AbrB family looped-hinge helix DNA binding protein